MPIPSITPAEAAAMIQNGDSVALSGFTPAGVPKCIPSEIAARAKAEHDSGKYFKINLITGASVGPSVDTAFSEADAIDWRIPYTTNATFRVRANAGKVRYSDMALSTTATKLRQGVNLGIDWGIIEACEVEDFGERTRIYPTAGVGITPTICRLASKGIFIERNKWHSTKIIGMHDLYEVEDHPFRTPIRITQPIERIGLPYIEVKTSQIRGIYDCELPDEINSMTKQSATTGMIGAHVSDFLLHNMLHGYIPKSLILQSGVGATANSVLGELGKRRDVPDFSLYTEVLQEAPLKLMLEGRIRSASTCSLTVSSEHLREMYENMNDFRGRLVLRPSEISNNPEVIARLGVCALNTAIEADIYGHVNSSKVGGTHIMNGIGGSSDFTNNAALSIFACASTAKEGRISSIVPFCSHIDHTNHFVDAIVTEYGVADLRGKSALEKADAVVAIAHPDYRPMLREYLKISAPGGGHTHHCLPATFAMHDTLRRKGDMRLTDWAEYLK